MKASPLTRSITDGRQARAIFNYDPRIVSITVYDDGFVPSSYRWPAPGVGRIYTLVNGHVVCHKHFYDRKRRYGTGPEWVAMSAKNGRLASY